MGSTYPKSNDLKEKGEKVTKKVCTGNFFGYFGFVMNDESLAKVMAELEKQIGSERLSAIRREAAKRGVSVLTLLGEAVSSYIPKLTGEAA